MVKDETGHVYGRLRVIKQHISIGEKAAWLCECTCGNTKIVTGDNLRRGNIKSCGCFRAECYHKNNLTHGMTSTPTYRSWQEMRVRCSDPTAISYHNYGARGISVCRRWEKFENFLLDMGVRPSGTSLDRKDTNKGYVKSNCRWATRLVQNRNKRDNVVVVYNRKKACLSAWCEELHIPYPRTYNRIVKKGWSAKKAFETPFVQHKDRRGLRDKLDL